MDYDFALIGCSAKKTGDDVPAKELYSGQLFQFAKRYCESLNLKFFVLSSLYGLVQPEQVVRIYDLRISELSKSEKQAWARRVLTTLSDWTGLKGKTCLFLAGSEYLDPLKSYFDQTGVTIDQPLKGLGIGSQMKWLKGALSDE